jgi:hypothetical protein
MYLRRTRARRHHGGSGRAGVMFGGFRSTAGHLRGVSGEYPHYKRFHPPQKS